MTAPTEKAAPIPALLPCPFCGGPADPVMQSSSPTCVWVICDNVSSGCGCEGPYQQTEAAAVEAWNRRADREARPSLPDSREERIRAEAAEDERDRLYARAVEHRGHSNSTTRWTKEQGAMLPADRARARQGGNNG